MEIGEYGEGLEAWANGMRLLDADLEAATAAYQAAIRYRETGVPQTFSDFEMHPAGLFLLYAYSGQPDRAIELFEGQLVRPRAYGWAALLDAVPTSDLLSDDPRYQALLEEAGITW